MKTMFDTMSVQSMLHKEKSLSPNTEKACENFEAFFVSILMNELQKTAGFSDKSFMEQSYMTVANQKVSEFIARNGIGIKDMLMRYIEQGGTKVSPSSVDNMDNKDR